jgi:hypothetical protein
MGSQTLVARFRYRIKVSSPGNRLHVGEYLTRNHRIETVRIFAGPRFPCSKVCLKDGHLHQPNDLTLWSHGLVTVV